MEIIKSIDPPVPDMEVRLDCLFKAEERVEEKEEKVEEEEEIE